MTQKESRAPTDLRRGGARGDEGATLILALIFLVVVSLVIIGIERWTGNNLSNTSKFVSAQSTQSEANSANDLAIQFVRYTFMTTSMDGQAPAPCWNTTSTAASQYPPSGETFPGPTVLPVDAWCMTRFYPANSQRVVTISTCQNTVTTGAACESQPLLQTIVTIHDLEAGCPPLPLNPTVSDTTCGTTMKISDWQFGAVPPIIQNFPSPGFTCASGTPVKVSGSGLALATNVDFVVKATAGSSNPVMAPGTMASGASSFNVPPTNDSIIEACTPASLSAYSSFYVIVSTPMGSNTSGASSLWPPG